MEKLSENEIDETLKDRDDRKPGRKIVDDILIPAGGVVVGAGAAAVKALGNLKQVHRIREVE